MKVVNLVFDLQSHKRFEYVLSQFGQSATTAFSKCLEVHAEEVMGESVNQVPVDTFTLVSTDYVGKVMEGKEVISIHFGYANEDTDRVNPLTLKAASSYAIEVHEDLAIFHEHGNAKFLEQPLLDSRNKLSDALEETLREILGQ